MGDLHCREFQQVVGDHLIRHRSILDVLSKLQETSAHVERAVIKSVTVCGCLQIDASRQELPSNATYSDLKKHAQNHLQGELCDSCRDNLETELGQVLFYVAAVCELMNIDIDDVMEKEKSRVTALGVYSLT